MALCECKNKENIPPFSSGQTTPFSTKTIRRRFRKPLADITNLHNSSPQSASHSDSQLPQSVSVSAPNSRKRKAVDDTDSMQCTLFKTLRRNLFFVCLFFPQISFLLYIKLLSEMELRSLSLVLSPKLYYIFNLYLRVNFFNKILTFLEFDRLLNRKSYNFTVYWSNRGQVMSEIYILLLKF